MKLRLIHSYLLLGLGLLIAYTPMTQSAYKDDNDSATEFVREQLKATNFPDPDSVHVRFYKYYAATYRSWIYVPKSLIIVIAEKNNTEKFKTDENFEAWYNIKCIKESIYQELYSEVIEIIKNKNWAQELNAIKDLIRQQDEENYWVAQGTIDHEATHLTKNHTWTKENFYDASAKLALGYLAINAIITGLYSKSITSWANDFILRSFNLFIVHKSANLCLSRNCEWEADEGVRDDENILRAKARWYAYHQKTKGPFPKNKLGAYGNYLWSCLCFADSTHPRSAARASRFNERADALVKQQANQTETKG